VGPIIKFNGFKLNVMCAAIYSAREFGDLEGHHSGPLSVDDNRLKSRFLGLERCEKSVLWALD
jgi:hypothetical protein